MGPTLANLSESVLQNLLRRAPWYRSNLVLSTQQLVVLTRERRGSCTTSLRETQAAKKKVVAGTVHRGATCLFMCRYSAVRLLQVYCRKRKWL